MSNVRGEGGYLFLSHSHEDIKIVRKLRNILEDNNMDALCFYLKCLNDDTEVFDLIKREIDSRKQFVFIDSENSRKSVWVQREREYVRQCSNKIIHTVPLSDIIASPQDAADKILFSMRIFISYRKKDQSTVKGIADELIRQDFQVWYDCFLTPGENIEYAIDSKIKEACEYGAFVLVLSESCLDGINYVMQYEYPYAVSLKGFIIPVWIGKSPWASVEKDFIRCYQGIGRYSVVEFNGDFSSTARKIADVIKRAVAK